MQGFEDFQPCPTGHADVGDDRIEIYGCLASDKRCQVSNQIDAVTTFHRRVAIRAQYLDQKPPHRIVIFGKKDAGPATYPRCHRRRAQTVIFRDTAVLDHHVTVPRCLLASFASA